jgi:hypothetical protein
MHAPTQQLPGSRDWYLEQRTWRDVLNCLLGRHQPITRALHKDHLLNRCSCGAFQENDTWFFLTQPERKGRWNRRPQQAPIEYPDFSSEALTPPDHTGTINPDSTPWME